MTHPLTAYRKRENLTLEAFAEKIGANKAMVWKWESRKSEPRPKYRAKIEEATGGAVRPGDLIAQPTEGAA